MIQKLSLLPVMDETLTTCHFSNNKRLLDTKENYDVKIQIGVEFNIKELHAHSSILYTQCPFFRGALTNLTKEDGYYILQVSNINEQIFETILK